MSSPAGRARGLWFNGEFELVDVGGSDAVEVIEVPAADELGDVELVGVSDLPPGAQGISPVHTHVQDDPADVWIVDHNLGHRPTAWSLYDEHDRLCDEFLVEHPTVNRVLVRMDIPIAGAIRLI